MASVTNLKLRDGVGTVVPVEAFPTQKMDGKLQRCINSWINIGDSYMFCYMLPCDKSTTSGDFICTTLKGNSTLRVSVGLPGLSCEDEWISQW